MEHDIGSTSTFDEKCFGLVVPFSYAENHGLAASTLRPFCPRLFLSPIQISFTFAVPPSIPDIIITSSMVDILKHVSCGFLDKHERSEDSPMSTVKR